jgi:hypothetical protein
MVSYNSFEFRCYQNYSFTSPFNTVYCGTPMVLSMGFAPAFALLEQRCSGLKFPCRGHCAAYHTTLTATSPYLHSSELHA